MKRRKWAGFLLSMAIVFMMLMMGDFSSEVNAEGIGYPIGKDNVNSIPSIARSYLVPTDSGYCRVIKTEDALFAEEYNDSLELINRRSIEIELDKYAGFFSGKDAYFFVFYTTNVDENTRKEVIRVVKYSKDWNRISAAALTGGDNFGYQIRYPFVWGTCTLGEVNGKLYLATGHEGYVDASVGQGHQGFLMFEIDETSMTGEIVSADLWHSFSQHLAIKDANNIFVLEESEGSEGTYISRMSQDRLVRDPKICVLRYGGQRTSAWAVATCATADGISFSDQNVLAVGTSIDQSKYDNNNYNNIYNVYFSVTPMNRFTEGDSRLLWITNDKDTNGFRGVKLVKVNDNRFLIMWEKRNTTEGGDNENPLGNHTLHYLFVDGNGKKLTAEKTAAVPLSDCEPALKDGKVVWCASSEGIVEFCLLDTETGAVSDVKYRLAGENATWELNGGVLRISGTGKVKNNLSETFPDREKITKIVIEKGITEIGDYAFSGLQATSVTLPEGLKKIGECAFSGFQAEEIVIPDGVTTIGRGAFSGTQSLRKAVIPDSVTKIGEDAFFTGWYWIGSEAKVYYVTFYCSENSYARKYADSLSIKWKTGAGGWKQNGNKWYYLDADDTPQTGWLETGGKKYYLGTDGAMVKGWIVYGGKWYYLGGDGAMRTGWVRSGGKWYLLGDDGAMLTGWQKVSGKWYCLKPSGEMAVNEYYKGYWLNKTGVWSYKPKASWKQDKKGWWFGDTAGWYARNTTLTINGKQYSFDNNGYLK